VPVSSVLALIGFVGLCLLVGVVGGSVSGQALRVWYPTLVQPIGTPPNWVFAPVWTVLYVMIGVAAWLVWKRRGPSRALRLWGWQLAGNALWMPAFFTLRSPALGMGVLAGTLLLIALTIRAFRRVQPVSVWLMLPYAGWTLYATYLNAGFWLLNHR